jgi:hypothetical protein
MTGKFTPEVLFIYRKEAISLMMNLLLLMVVLSSMDAFDAPTKFLERMKYKTV